MTKWYSIDDVLGILRSSDWLWWRNTRCKYLNLRLDTRNGGVQLFDRDNVEITLDELKSQNCQGAVSD